MAAEKTLIYFGPGRREPSALIHQFTESHSLNLVSVGKVDEISSLMNRSFPACLVLDAQGEAGAALDVCRTVKGDAFTAIVPTVILAPSQDEDLAADALEAGADEVVTDAVSERERLLRMELVLHRAARDVSVHPSTRLPGTVQIDRDLMERMAEGFEFAVCYADLDHFKEFNDR
ncbi:MAG TPA: hypothetical protein VGA70_12670, partial [Longimicrobiales bacterium]